MADNVKVQNFESIANGPVIATDEVAGVQYQRVKLDLGADGASAPVVGTMPVSMASATDGSQKTQIVDSEGDSVDVRALSSQIISTDKGLVTNAVIHGKTTAGGGSYVDVKVSPSGSIQAEIADAIPTGAELEANSTELSNGQTYTSTAYDVSPYASVVVAVKTDKSGLLYIEFSPDNSNWDSSLSFTVSAGINEVHRLSVTRKYFRVRFTNNSGGAQTYFRIQLMAGNQPPLTSTINSSIQSDADALVTRSILVGQTDGGVFVNVPVTSEGHVEAAIHGPRLPFGSVHTENLTPIFQADAVYGINTQLVRTTVSGTGTATATNGEFVVATGNTSGSAATIQSRKRLRYRAGQGMVGRFTARFTSPAADSYQLAGLGHAEDGVYFGYQGTTFGILYVVRGVREVRTLTINTASSTNENVTVTLNSVPFSIAVTNSGNTARTAFEIAQGTFAGWQARPVGSTVVFLRNSSGTASGTYSVTGSTISGSFAQTKAGSASSDTFIPQTSWNGDTMDGGADAENPSGVLLDPTKGNVFEIGLQYLGYGTIAFKVEAAPSGNNADWITVHTLQLPNTLTAPSFGNPSMPITITAYSAGSTTNLSVYCASFAGFIEGQRKLDGPRMVWRNTSTSVGASAYHVLFSIYNALYYGSRANQAIINVLSINASLKHTQPATIYLFKSSDPPSLAGNPNFATYAATSCSYYDTAATTFAITDNSQLVWAGELSETGNIQETFASDIEEITLQPGEYLIAAGRTSTGSAAYTSISVTAREDH